MIPQEVGRKPYAIRAKWGYRRCEFGSVLVRRKVLCVYVTRLQHCCSRVVSVQYNPARLRTATSNSRHRRNNRRHAAAGAPQPPQPPPPQPPPPQPPPQPTQPVVLRRARLLTTSTSVSPATRSGTSTSSSISSIRTAPGTTTRRTAGCSCRRPAELRAVFERLLEVHRLRPALGLERSVRLGDRSLRPLGLSEPLGVGARSDVGPVVGAVARG